MRSDLRKFEPVTINVTPGAGGRQLVRYSLPFPQGYVRDGQRLLVCDGEITIPAALRALTNHPGTGETVSVRRGLVTFPHEFKSLAPVTFELTGDSELSEQRTAFAPDVAVDGETVRIGYPDGFGLCARLIAPARAGSEPARTEIIESNSYFTWIRTFLPDPRWPRVIEVRADVLGGVTVVAHLQRNLRGNGYAPGFGWEMEAETGSVVLEEEGCATEVGRRVVRHSFAEGAGCAAFSGDRCYALRHPAAPFKRRGAVTIKRESPGRFAYRYLRCASPEKVPMQEASWRKAEFAIAPVGLAPLTETLEYAHTVTPDPRLWEELYGIGANLDLRDYRELAEAVEYHRDAIRRGAVVGDDWGDVTSFHHDCASGAVYGVESSEPGCSHLRGRISRQRQPPPQDSLDMV